MDTEPASAQYPTVRLRLRTPELQEPALTCCSDCKPKLEQLIAEAVATATAKLHINNTRLAADLKIARSECNAARVANAPLKREVNSLAAQLKSKSQSKHRRPLNQNTRATIYSLGLVHGG